MKKTIIWLLVITVGLWGAVHLLFGPFGTWRYKMTVEVETPEGVKTGYAIREVNAVHGLNLLPEEHSTASATGEAVAVDLGGRGVLFALVGGGWYRSTDSAYRLVFRTFPMPNNGGGLTPEGIRFYDHLRAGARDIPLGEMPLMVAFKNRNDPKSLQIAYEVERYDIKAHGAFIDYGVRVKTDNMEKIFGEGVHLKRVMVEMTRKPVTWGIEKWLPWIEEPGNQRHERKKLFSNVLPNGIDKSWFRAGKE